MLISCSLKVLLVAWQPSYIHNSPESRDVMTRTSGDLFEIKSQESLTLVVDTLVTLLAGGSERKAADVIGLSQSTLNRLRRGGWPNITRDTAIALETATKLVSDELTRQFRSAVISPDALRIFRDGYRAWVTERFARWEERDGPSWHVDAAGQLTSTGTAEPLQLCASRRAMVRAMWQAAHSEFSDVFATFRGIMVGRHVERDRQEVAVLRVLEPLLEASQSGYVERSWSELSAKERRDFIDAGIRRELILLDREPALTRATRIATEGAHTFARKAQAATEATA